MHASNQILTSLNKNQDTRNLSHMPQSQNETLDRLKLIEQVQAQLIKNSKKHLGKDNITEELLKQLRGMLDTMADKNGDLPKVYNSQTHLNQMINDLIQNNVGLQAQQVGRVTKV